MQFKFVLLLFYISLINQALTSNVHDLNKYGKLEDFNETVVILDSHDFKVDEEIYIIITGYFYFEYIEYIFIDSLDDLVDANLERKLIKEYSNKIETLNADTNLKKRYYTIEKTESHLNGKEGKYLALYAYMDGTYDIENTEKNKGNSKVVIACVVVGVVVIVIVVGIICYCRKRKKQQQNNQNATTHQNVNVQNNNYNNSTPYNNNAPYNNGTPYNNNAPYNNRTPYNNNAPYNNPNANDNGFNSGNAFNNGNYYNNGYN